MKKIIICAAVVLSCVAVFKLFPGKNNAGKVTTKKVTKICVCQVIEHEALNSVVSGMSEYLKSNSGNMNYSISVETCQGNMALASQIIAKFASSGADIVVTVGTIPSQAAYKFAKAGKIKVVFSSVTNPDDISPNIKNSNITGVSNFVAIEPQLELFRRIQPNLKNLGVIYNTGEANSTYIVERLRGICSTMGLNLVEQGMSKIAELPQVTEKIATKVDAVFISNDNMALSGISNIISICRKNNVPVYVSDMDQVEKGCVAALGPSQYDIGVQTGKIVQRISDGEDINGIAVQYPETTELYINTKSISQSVLQIPQEIVSQAKRIF